jgi:FlaA1/EpsC-like NDP-sugar epimerase
MSGGNEIFVFEMGSPVKIADLAKRMIKLAGYEPDKDIRIEYTGLRPGEKLYEEVLSDKEDTKPTSHKKIRIAAVRQYNYEDIVPVFDDLTKLSLECKVMETVRKMKEAVPEFKSNNSRFEAIDKELEKEGLRPRSEEKK